METDDAEFERAVRGHDERVAQLGLSIWVGSEPTFTDRQALAPAWLHSALGDDKERRAQALLRNLSRLMPGGLLLRSVGRLYPGEKLPRWNLGLLRRRDGSSLWGGPPDPIQATTLAAATPMEIGVFGKALSEAFERQSWSSACAQVAEGTSAWNVTVQTDEGPERPLGFLLHGHPCEVASDAEPISCVAIELPAIDSVGLFLTVLSCVEGAARACDLPALVLTGATPPVDATLELTTVTPDPAVIEINTAPSQNCAEFLWRSRQVYAAAAAQQVSPYRLYFNGQVADSGGAGQITFGGPTPQASPFVENPRLLPRLVRFLNRHPALSYLFSHDFVGGSGQSVRPDERGTDAFDDLKLALALLGRESDVAPELLWKSLASFLCDAVGNSHRAEINIEKLWNPFLPGRGCLGLVEFRSLRMQHTPERATAVACLFRSVIALLASGAYELTLIDWGRELHDRFALPFYLQEDLQAVLAELDAAQLGLGKPIQDVLHQNEFRFFGKVDFAFGTLELWRGLEFWPLVGDAASPEQSGSSRMVDASTTRIEVRWLPPVADPTGAGERLSWLDWSLYVDETCLPMRHENDRRGEVQVFGVRYSSFVPRSGLHPTRDVQAPLTLTLRHVDHASQFVIQLHEWEPEGRAYPGLPTDLNDARERRAARITVDETERPVQARLHASKALVQPSPLGLTPYSLDRRYR
jgi:uncharacterized protein (DUF2126 family)